jgi:hypothetical protein
VEIYLYFIIELLDIYFFLFFICTSSYSLIYLIAMQRFQVLTDSSKASRVGLGVVSNAWLIVIIILVILTYRSGGFKILPYSTFANLRDKMARSGFVSYPIPGGGANPSGMRQYVEQGQAYFGDTFTSARESPYSQEYPYSVLEDASRSKVNRLIAAEDAASGSAADGFSGRWGAAHSGRPVIDPMLTRQSNNKTLAFLTASNGIAQ